MKRCTKCGETKATGAFCFAAHRRDRLSCWCRECDKRKGRAYRANNRDKELLRARKKYQRRKAEGQFYPRQDVGEKTCFICKQIKHRSLFTTNRICPDGVSTYCRRCDYLRRRKELVPEKQKEAAARYHAKKPWKRLEMGRNWTASNREKVNSKAARRRADKMKATPEWLTPEHHEKILEFYAMAAWITLQTGDEHHVDHIHPLKGKNFCGLHVPWNLQLLSIRENSAKHNRLLDPSLAYVGNNA